NLAYLLAEQGESLKEAAEMIERARKQAPKDPSLMDTAGWVAFKKGEYPSAVALFEEAARLTPNSPTVQYHLGMASLKAGKKEEARAALTKALELSKDFPESAKAKSALAEIR
ncbi:MAG: tetratricopeptide repeat protein, partial [Nitrospirae bacterium]|nr:tetratricopeptide repeat protein [Nitrospirota bacterium]